MGQSNFKNIDKGIERTSESNYLKRELYERVSCEPSIFEFLQRGSLDGLWYWDLENPEHE